jgi:tetratricopeptide (TPR) repeat protein
MSPLKNKYHTCLANYFSAKPLFFDCDLQKKPVTRKLVEQPWQLLKSEQWSNLVVLLREPEFLIAAWRNDANSIKRIWSSIETCSEFRVKEAYGDFTRRDNLTNNELYTRVIAEIFENFGLIKEALEIYKIFLDDVQSILDENGVQGKESEDIDAPPLSLQRYLFENTFAQAKLETSLGNYERAIKLFNVIKEFAQKWNNQHMLIAVLIDRSNILSFNNKKNEAIKALNEAERISKEENDLTFLSVILINKALLIMELGNPAECESILNEVLKNSSVINDEAALQNVIGNLAIAFHKQGNFDKAVEYFRMKEKMCRELGKKDSLQVAICNLALALKEQGKLSEALELMDEQELICVEIKHHRGLAFSYTNKALILDLMGRPQEAFQKALLAKEIIDDYNLAEMRYTFNLIIRDIMIHLMNIEMSSGDFK